MQPFIQVDVGDPMSEAGPHFPVVLKDGEPVTTAAKLTA